MEGKRGWFLTVCAVLFAVLALSNFLKPVLADAHTGFVFFGHRLSGVPNDVIGPVFGLILVAYVIAIWQMRRFALPLAWVYAGYVVTNTVLFSMFTTDKPPSPTFMVGALVLGLGIPISAAIALTQKRAQLT
ncbi:MAG: hypothetical protein JO121_04775 [Deltaproteobacteria bacterium]|jgi:hypothetical protein|nr:hypothetical protein [Deltaproteobacteria bacterium]